MSGHKPWSKITRKRTTMTREKAFAYAFWQVQISQTPYVIPRSAAVRLSSTVAMSAFFRMQAAAIR